MTMERNGNAAAQEPDLIDRIANALPEELRADYYREMAHCRTLPESDEMLRILRAMQFLTVLIEQTPARLAEQRAELSGALSDAIAALHASHQAGIAYQKQLDGRLSKLPDEIAERINADAIAARLNEHLRQQMQESGLTSLADAVGVQAVGLRKAGKELALALDGFSHPRLGAVPVVNNALTSMKANVDNAADHIRTQMNGLGKELWRTIAVIFTAGVALGVVLGILYYRWITSPYDSRTPEGQQMESVQQNRRAPQSGGSQQTRPGRTKQQ